MKILWLKNLIMDSVNLAVSRKSVRKISKENVKGFNADFLDKV